MPNITNNVYNLNIEEEFFNEYSLIQIIWNWTIKEY
jgi:hypothetical protein